jgi:hypothetical protein
MHRLWNEADRLYRIAAQFLEARPHPGAA